MEVVPRKQSSVVSRKIADEHLLVPISRRASDVASIYALNEVAGRIWELIDGKTPVSRICHTIEAEFEVDHEQAQRDIEAFVEQLEKAGAIENA